MLNINTTCCATQGFSKSGVDDIHTTLAVQIFFSSSGEKSNDITKISSGHAGILICRLIHKTMAIKLDTFDRCTKGKKINDLLVYLPVAPKNPVA